MNTYRLYSVDRTGKITSAQRVYAECDDEAIELARVLSTESNCEVWKGQTFVAAVSTMAEPVLRQGVRN